MTTEEKILWTKIASFNLDDDNSDFKFSTRLARENGWTISYAKQVIEEYKKFIFLCCITNSGVTPSDQVDQAWHLHLTYTRSYWVDLCRNTLSREIHHNPTKGGHLEGKKFDSFYSDTLQLYKEKFKTIPPQHIWPDNKTRFSDIHFQRVNIKKFWLLRRPYFNRKNVAMSIIVFLSLFFIRSKFTDDIVTMTVFFAVVGFIFWNIFRGKNGGNGSSCSAGSCGGDSGHSGCGGDSGCGGGCSGCGGD